ncbi:MULTISPECIES: hypothetical protein [unclassified Caballeronia]|uniref:hypothetical protein n=1 Tax=unclassified Caballeronia TaxID=2646786 RepID=UPI00285B2C4A|nr:MULTISPECIES: hypothetical protein [unclassified Caballeronia]MDR5772079.1 hypothetical protein [Caballeronia sp. LZ002]MDR5847513.1 hypothetical protein [Caballeronia sp. LZ003]
MAKLIVREIREGDIEHIAAYMRPADLDEVEAGTGVREALAVLQVGVQSSSPCWTIEVGGEPAGIFGASPTAPTLLVPSVGAVWMLGTPMLERAPKQLTKLGRTYVRRMAEQYGTLMNFVDARNLKSIHWLARLGFTVQRETVPYGPFGLPFHRFGMNQ